MYLHDRPRYFVKNCVDKLQAASQIKAKFITEQEDGKYLVKASLNREAYLIDLGLKSNKLSCKCFDWKRHKLPCKHIMAVIGSGKGVFSSIAESYREAPYYRLDNAVIPGGAVKSTSEHHISTTIEPSNEEISILEIPVKRYPTKTRASSCRELLQEIKSLTFVAYDEEALESLEESLFEIRERLYASCPQDEGLIIEDSKATRRKQTTNDKSFVDLPLPRKKSSQLITSRVGVRAELKRASTVTKIDQCLSKSKDNKVMVEEIDLTIPFSYDIPFEDNEDDIVITNEIPAPFYHDNKISKKRKLLLSDNEKSSIQNKEMLSDESINLAQTMLSNQFPELDGLMDTVLCQTNGFDVLATTKKAVQILYTSAQHWICVANLDTKRRANNYIAVYDSLSSGGLTSSVASQLACICCTPEKSIRVDIKCVQQQENGVDCGVFAIAFATSLAFGSDPSKIFFDPEQLRPHLISCLEKGFVDEFPTITSGKFIRCRSVIKTIEVFCNCRMPYRKGKNSIPFGPTVCNEHHVSNSDQIC